ncbi:hypothetical protein NBRC116587_22390 [Pseudoteredinibacter isoporae]
MKKYMAVTSLAALLSACTTSMSDQSLAHLNSGNNRDAWDTFMQCAQAGDSNCMYNLGYILHQSTATVEGGEQRCMGAGWSWIELSARIGNLIAINTLQVAGREISTTDLYRPPAQQAPNADMATLLLGLGAAAYTVSNPVPSSSKPQLQCTSAERFGRIETVCN